MEAETANNSASLTLKAEHFEAQHGTCEGKFIGQSNRDQSPNAAHMQDDGREGLGERKLSQRRFFRPLFHAPMRDKHRPTILKVKS